MKLYGTHICPDCEDAEAVLKEKNIDYVYVDITETTANLKEFLKIRDTNPLFHQVKRDGGIGIPCFVLEDGSVTLEINDCTK